MNAFVKEVRGKWRVGINWRNYSFWLDTGNISRSRALRIKRRWEMAVQGWLGARGDQAQAAK